MCGNDWYFANPCILDKQIVSSLSLYPNTSSHFSPCFAVLFHKKTKAVKGIPQTPTIISICFTPGPICLLSHCCGQMHQPWVGPASGIGHWVPRSSAQRTHCSSTSLPAVGLSLSEYSDNDTSVIKKQKRLPDLTSASNNVSFLSSPLWQKSPELCILSLLISVSWSAVQPLPPHWAPSKWLCPQPSVTST